MGTIVSHCGAVVLVIAVALRPALSWQEKDLALLPGRIYSVSRGDGLSIQAAGATLLTYKTLYYELIEAVEGGPHGDKLLRAYGRLPDDLPDIAA